MRVLQAHTMGWRLNRWVPLVYPLGDALAQWIVGPLDYTRLGWLTLTSFTLYNLEIPRWFEVLHHFKISAATCGQHIWLGWFFKRHDGHLSAAGKTLGAILYFNPLWVARHYFILRLSTYSPTTWAGGAWWKSLLTDGCKSFFSMLPLTILGNYFIQEKISLRYRFLASAIMSGIMAFMYALIEVWWRY